MAGNESFISDIKKPSRSNWNDIISNYARKTNGYNLPLNLPRTEISSLSPDVVFWLVELRHNTGEVNLQDIDVIPQQGVLPINHQVLPESTQEDIDANIQRYLDECVSENQSKNNITDFYENQISHLDCDNEYSLLNFDLQRKKSLAGVFDESKEYRDWEELKISKLSVSSNESSVDSVVSYSKTKSEISDMACKPGVLWEANPAYLKDGEKGGKMSTDNESDEFESPHATIAHLHSPSPDNDDGLTRHRDEVQLRRRERNTSETNEAYHVLNKDNNYGADYSGLELGEKKKSILDVKCENILSNLDEMIKKFEDIQERNLTGGNAETVLDLRDNDFVKMCETAENIIEETLKLHVDSVKDIKNRAEVSHNTPSRTSELSDEVFIEQEVNVDLSRTTGHPFEHEGHARSDINEIFDQGSGGKPPVPPRRKKKVEMIIPISGGQKNIDERESSMTHQGSTVSSNIADTIGKSLEISKRVKTSDESKIATAATEKSSTNDEKKQMIDNCTVVIIDSVISSNESTPSRGYLKLEIPKVKSDNVSSKDTWKSERSFSKDTEDENHDLKIHLTPTRPISSITFPPNDSQNENSVSPHSSLAPNCSSTSFSKSHENVSRDSAEIFDSKTNDAVTRRSSGISRLSRNSNIYILPTPNSDDSTQVGRYKKLDETPSTSISQNDESIERLRKGSNASDIAAWKKTLSSPYSVYHDDEMDPTTMESHEWFSSQDTDLSGSLYSVNDLMERSPSLPSINISTVDSDPETPATGKTSIVNMLETLLRNKQTQNTPRAKSMLAVSSTLKISGSDNIDPAQQIVWDDNTVALQEGLICRTKITENGKKVRKNWTKSYLVLTNSFLIFFKDMKSYHTMKINMASSRPDLCIDLCGTVVETDEKLTSRKYTFVVTSNIGLQVLLQAPNALLCEQWLNAIINAIEKLNAQYMTPYYDARLKPVVVLKLPSLTDDGKGTPLLRRVRSVKRDTPTSKNTESTEDLAKSVEERQTKTKARLKHFFNKRPTKEFLVRKGIYKDEPMFGRELSEVVQDCIPSVPMFVSHCIQAIESKDENMKTDGLYRASGNLSQVQKIRLQVDQNCLAVLDVEEDVHVLTGVLKLFFRELKKPLISFHIFHRAIVASTIQSQKERIRQLRDLVRELSAPNHDTLNFLLQHLLRVTANHEFNRMHIPNIAIVFGPTLMWPEQESLNMALDLMKQNLVIERLLVDYEDIFQ